MLEYSYRKSVTLVIQQPDNARTGFAVAIGIYGVTHLVVICMVVEEVLMLIRKILMVRIFVISIRILVISLNILVGCSCQLFSHVRTYYDS